MSVRRPLLACLAGMLLFVLAPRLVAAAANGPASTSSSAATPQAPGGPPAGPAAEPLDLMEFAVDGDTVLGAPAIERVLYPFLGPQRPKASLQAAVKALEKAYSDAGYLSVVVDALPAQPGDEAGLVRLQVLQGRVASLRITGAEYHLPSRIREAVPSLARGSVPQFPEMQEELGALSRSLPDASITPLLSAGAEPGTLAVELKVQDQPPLHGSLELNNKQAANTLAGRLEAGLSYDNLFQARHSVSANWMYAPRRPKDMNVLTLNYGFPLGGPEDRLALALVHSDSDTPTSLGGATISRGDTWRLRWRDQLRSRPGADHAITWGLTSRHLQDRNRDVAGVDRATPSLRYASLSVAYELNLDARALGGPAGRRVGLQAEFSTGIGQPGRRQVDCFGSELEQFDCKRTGAVPRFQVLNAAANWSEPIGAWRLAGQLQGQYSALPLVPAEQVSYGGRDTVRGYLEGEHAGDRGLALRAEVHSPAWSWRNQLSLQGLLFLDGAVVQRVDPLPGEDSITRLASLGLGLSAQLPGGLRGALVWARVLPDGSSKRSHWLDVSLSHRF